MTVLLLVILQNLLAQEGGLRRPGTSTVILPFGNASGTLERNQYRRLFKTPMQYL